ncbi:MAG TPA: hypothetical protein VFG52_04400 [Xanthomonadales bacterium]|nr:hypothetical protein [Xanthomonadales bacterium]
MRTIREQLRNNAVALLSLAIAITALGYNTWRNEKTEDQRNIRSAAFRVLETLGELREVVDDRYYYQPFRTGMGMESALRIRGYGRAAMTRDLMNLMPPPAPATGQELHAAWIKHFNVLDELGSDGKHSARATESEQAIGTALEESRKVVLEVIAGLD